MKILKLLNKKILSITLVCLIFFTPVFAEEKPIDIWNIEKKNNQLFQKQIFQVKILAALLRIVFTNYKQINKQILLNLIKNFHQKKLKLLDYMILVNTV